jgi:hypothetical protein
VASGLAFERRPGGFGAAVETDLLAFRLGRGFRLDGMLSWVCCNLQGRPRVIAQSEKNLL